MSIPELNNTGYEHLKNSSYQQNPEAPSIQSRVVTVRKDWKGICCGKTFCSAFVYGIFAGILTSVSSIIIVAVAADDKYTAIDIAKCVGFFGGIGFVCGFIGKFFDCGRNNNTWPSRHW